MFPNVFALLSGSSDVLGFVGSSTPRMYRHGHAPQNVAKPYITWFVMGTPELDLEELPSIDRIDVQVDCWSDADKEVELMAVAVRDTIEPHHHMISFGPSGRDPETMRYRMTMTFTFWTHRP